MDTDGKRRQVTFEQLTALLEFLTEHVELAKGFTRGRRGKFHTLKLWNLCAKKLNAVKEDGAIKDGKGWSKYWCDWKYRVRRRALELKAARENNRPPPDGVVPLSDMEETILSIIGVNAVEGVVIKSDPLADGDTEEEPDNNENNLDNATTRYDRSRLRSSRGRKRRHPSKEHNISDYDDHGGTSSPVERKPRVRADRNDDNDDSDNDEASQFLKLEREKLENSKNTLDSLQTIASEITRLADVMGHIRDILSNNRINL